jgi:DNA-binding GntR family transcriptional regulator
MMGTRFRRMELLHPSLDRGSPVPLYFQVAQHLESAIERGELQVGDRLENEVALAERWGLSRPTMRQAIGHLVDKGLLVRQRGVGTEVVRRHVQRPVQLTSLYEDLQDADQDPTTDVLVHERTAVDDMVAGHLGIPTGTEVIRLERVRRARGVPLAILRNWLPVPVAGSISREALEEKGLYACLRSAGVTVRSAQQRIGARAASPAEATLLDLRRGAPLLVMERTAFDERARVIEWGSHVYDARGYSFTVTLRTE